MTMLCIITALLQVVNLILINLKRTIVFPLSLMVYAGYSVVEIQLAYEVNPAILTFVVLNLVGIVTAVCGWVSNGKAFVHVNNT